MQKITALLGVVWLASQTICPPSTFAQPPEQAVQNNRLSIYVFSIRDYQERNRDLSFINPRQLEQHWLNNGIREGRVASPVFDVQYYLRTNPDLIEAFGKDYEAVLNHWIVNGIPEGRRGSETFDPSWYLKKNGAVARQYGATNYYGAIEHYMKTGRAQGLAGAGTGRGVTRRAAVTSLNHPYIFDARFYLDSNPDLRESLGSDNLAGATQHWLNKGLREGRTASPVFDVQYYRQNTREDYRQNTREDYRQNAREEGSYAQALNYWFTTGLAQGQRGSRLFDVRYYIRNNRDIAKDYGKDYEKALNHWLTRGLSEGRAGSAEFDPIWYLQQNSDVERSVGKGNFLGAAAHWVSTGIRERRLGSPGRM